MVYSKYRSRYYLFQRTRNGNEDITKGDYGISIPALPRVPLTILFWAGDDEVQPSANVLFDSSANEHMETEALVWLAVATVSELKKADKVKKDRAKK